MYYVMPMDIKAAESLDSEGDRGIKQLIFFREFKVGHVMKAVHSYWIVIASF